MKRLALVAATLAVAGCGGGERVVEPRSVAVFDRIEVSGGLDVQVVRGDRGLRVRAGEDVMDRVTTVIEDGVLRLGLRERGIVIGPDPLGDATVRVTTNEPLRELTIDGAGDVELAQMETDALRLAVRGAGDIEAGGRVDRLVAEIQGVADADLARLAARTAQITVQGAASAELNVSETLDVTIQGPADVVYHGDPVVSSDIQGPGEVRRAGS